MIDPTDQHLDLAAIARDDELIESLRLGATLPVDDMTLGLLAALVADVRTGPAAGGSGFAVAERELRGRGVPGREIPGREILGLGNFGCEMPGCEIPGREIPEREIPGREIPGREIPERELAEVIDLTSPAAQVRRRLSRGLMAGGVVVAVLSTSGVAAAVTGDPLAPFKAVVRGVTSGELRDRPAPNPRAALNEDLQKVDSLIRAGDLTGAQRLLDRLRSDLAVPGRGDQGMVNRLAELEAKLARARQARRTPTQGPGSTGPAVPALPRPTSGPAVPTSPKDTPEGARNRPTHPTHPPKPTPTKPTPTKPDHGKTSGSGAGSAAPPHRSGPLAPTGGPKPRATSEASRAVAGGAASATAGSGDRGSTAPTRAAGKH